MVGARAPLREPGDRGAPCAEGVAAMVTPRFLHVPKRKSSLGGDAAKFAERNGLGLDEHQRLILDTTMGRTRSGKWASFANAVVEPRQNGKSHALIVRALYGGFELAEPLVLYSAHQWATANEIFLTMASIIESSDELMGQVKKTQHSAAVMGFELRNGCRIRFLTRSRATARGFTGNTLILDEAHFLSEAAHGALLPTLSARSAESEVQVFYAASAVDQLRHPDGLVMSAIRERGIAGDTPTLAYLEWSAEVLDDEGNELLPDQLLDDHVQDRELWRQANPACPSRISEDHIGYEAKTLDRRSFACERLGIGDWFSTDGLGFSIIGLDEWNALADENSRLRDPVCLAFDLSPERRAAVAAAGRNDEGNWHVEVITANARPKQAAEKVAQIVAEQRPARVVCDGYGPAASMVHALEEADVPVDTVTSSEHGQACGLLVDAVNEGVLRHLGSAELANAIRGASTRPLGDAWAWSRKSSSVDISPLVASTLALWAAMGEPEGGEFQIF